MKELDEFDALSSLLDSFERFIARNRQLGYHKKNYTNLIRFTRRLIQYQHDQGALAQMIAEIEQTGALANKDWLLEKANLLLK